MTVGQQISEKLPARIIARDEPHPSWGGWKGFIEQRCEVRDEADGVVFFGVTNCNYIVFPCGTLVQNFGYHGSAMMNDIREKGADAVLAEIKAVWAEVEEALACMREGRLYKRKR